MSQLMFVNVSESFVQPFQLLFFLSLIVVYMWLLRGFVTY